MINEKEFELKDLADGSSEICMAARVNKEGGADAIVHGTDSGDKEAVYKLIVLFALLLKALEEKTGYDETVICQVAMKYLDNKHKGHNKDCADHIETGWF